MSGNRPTPAEQLCSLLAATGSLTLHTPGHVSDLAGRHRMTPDGQLAMAVPAGSCVARQLTAEAELVAMVEATDIAPTVVRHRVRGRATLTGWLLPYAGEPADGDCWTVLDLATAELAVGAATKYRIEPEEIAGARPDPLATREAELLCHLADAHRHLLDRLCRLIPPDRLHTVAHVQPIRLDRFGIVLRLEFRDHNADVRLPFAAALDHIGQLESRMQELIARAGRCRRRAGSAEPKAVS